MRPTAEIQIGWVPLARNTFDTDLAAQVAMQVRASLHQAGFRVVGPETLVVSASQAETVARELTEASPDLLLVFQATFADSTMVMHLARRVDAPLLLWAVPEARTGGRLRLNSFCGLNLAAHALKRAGHRYEYLYAPPDHPSALERVRTLALAGRARRLLGQARIGQVGEPPAGLDTCRTDAGRLRNRIGLEVVRVDLGRVFHEVRTIAEQDVEERYRSLTALVYGLEELDGGAVRCSLATYLALRRIAERERLDGLAVRCWPEFFTDLGCAACGAMSMLSDELIPCSCEADVNGTVTQLILQWLSGEPAFGTDLVSIDVEKNEGVVWHCGLAPLSMADPTVRPRGTIHSNRRMPLLMEFPLKPGRVTLARLSEATGDYRLVVGGGEMVRSPLSFSGTSGVLRFDRHAAEVLDLILQEGLEHHFSLTYGDHAPALLALAKWLDLPVLSL